MDPLVILHQLVLGGLFMLLGLVLQFWVLEILTPRIYFSKSGMYQALLHPLRFFIRTKSSINKSGSSLIIINILAAALLPLSGSVYGDERTLLISFFSLMSLSNLFFILWSWNKNREPVGRSLVEAMVFHTLRLSLLLLIVFSAYVGGHHLLEPQPWMVLRNPTAILSLLLVMILVTYPNQTKMGSRWVQALGVFSALLWIGLFVILFFDTGAAPGASQFIFLLIKTVALLTLSRLMEAHLLRPRMDQIEKFYLVFVIPLTLVVAFSFLLGGVFL